MVLGLDELEELFGQVRLAHSSEGGHGEGVLRSFLGITALAGATAYGQSSIHGVGYQFFEVKVSEVKCNTKAVAGVNYTNRAQMMTAQGAGSVSHYL